jgi:hypothetical protein
MTSKTTPSKEQFPQGSDNISHSDFQKKGLGHRSDLIKTLVESSIVYVDLRIGVKKAHAHGCRIERNYAFTGGGGGLTPSSDRSHHGYNL